MFTRQPQYSAQVDRGNRLVDKSAFIATADLRDGISAAIPVKTGTTPLTATPIGTGILFAGGVASSTYAAYAAGVLTDVCKTAATIHVVATVGTLLGSGNGNGLIGKSANGSAGWQLWVGASGDIFFKISNTGADLVVSSSANAVLSNSNCCISVTMPSGTPVSLNDVRIYANGVDVTSSSPANASSAGTDSAIQLKIGTAASGTNDWSGVIALVAILGRRQSANEVAAFAKNPWQIFLSPKRKSFAPASGVNTFTYAPTGGFVFSGSSATVKAAIKTASGGIIFSGSSAQSRGKIEATPTGGIVLSGTAPEIRGVARLPSGGLTLSGSAAILRGAVKSVSGGLLFAGTAPVSFTTAVQSLVVNPIGGIVIAGSAALVRTCTRLVSGGFVFSGSAPFSSGTLLTSLGRWYGRSRRGLKIPYN